MKNKHLVALFIGVAALGGIGRVCRVNLGTKLDSVLFKEPISEVDKILICRKDTTIITRTPEQWLISEKDDTALLPDSVAMRLLGAVGAMKAVELLHTNQQDTLGLGPGHRLSIVCRSGHWPDQVFHFGNTTYLSGVAHTWVALPMHKQYYLVPGDIKGALDIDFRSTTDAVRLESDTAGWNAVRFVLEGDTLLNLQMDTAKGVWTQPPFGRRDTVPSEQVYSWQRHWAGICQKARPVNFFDKRSSPETFCGEFQFIYRYAPHSTVKYRLFFVSRPVLPDDPEKMRYFRNFKPLYLLESDLQPGFYFAIPETLAIQQLKHL